MDGKIEIGMSPPEWVRTTTFDNWNRYAAVNDEFVPIHMDDDAGREAGYPSAFGMGNLQWSYFHSMLRTWIGQQGRIESLQLQFRSPNLKGATVTCTGSVTDAQVLADGQRVTLDIRSEDEAGRSLAIGSATVLMTRVSTVGG